MKIKISDIALPQLYVRVKTDPKRIQDFMRLCLQLSPDQKIPSREKGKSQPRITKWPFPPILVFKNKPPIATDKTAKRTVKLYEVGDGNHRLKVAKLFHLKEIEAEVKSVTDPGERFLLQYQSCANGPLPPSNLERARAIWHMAHDFNFPQKRLAQITGFSIPSISRIINKKQGWQPAGKASANYGKNPASREAITNETQRQLRANTGVLWTPDQWFSRMEVALGEYGTGTKQSPYNQYMVTISKFDQRRMIRFYESLTALKVNAENILKGKERKEESTNERKEP